MKQAAGNIAFALGLSLMITGVFVTVIWRLHQEPIFSDLDPEIAASNAKIAASQKVIP